MSTRELCCANATTKNSLIGMAGEMISGTFLLGDTYLGA
jgi:hypothetical protein